MIFQNYILKEEGLRLEVENGMEKNWVNERVIMYLDFGSKISVENDLACFLSWLMLKQA